VKREASVEKRERRGYERPLAILGTQGFTDSFSCYFRTSVRRRPEVEMTFAKKNTAAPSSGESLNMTKNESPAHAPWLSWLQRPTVKYYGASEGREFEPHWGSSGAVLAVFFPPKYWLCVGGWLIFSQYRAPKHFSDINCNRLGL
jgi:hypothetical protein